MATEVCCGQCQGRLLVETLGVVVACPHCGVHLSIPAPTQTPAPAVAPMPVEAPRSVLSPAPAEQPQSFNPPAISPGPVNRVPAPVDHANSSPDDPHAASVFGGTDEQHAHDVQVGWASAPNLFLSPDHAAPVTDTAIRKQSLEMMGAVSNSGESAPPAAASTPAPTAVLPSFTESPPSAGAVSTTAPTAASDSGPVKFSTPQLLDRVCNDGRSPANAPGAPITAAPEIRPPVTPTPQTFSAPAPETGNPFMFEASPTVTAAATSAFDSRANSGLGSLDVSATVPGAAAGLGSRDEAERQKLMMWLIIVGSYASAVTIVLLYLVLFGSASKLESLPDLKPATNKNGDVSWDYNPPKNDLPSGHVLQLGQAQRFGSVRVTPLKVTRGAVQFEHFSGLADNRREPSNPVLKLWVKFENVSRDQTFAPLDPYVLFTRKSINLGERVLANGFVATESERKKGKVASHLFDMSVQSEFRMIGQKLGKDLKPGDSIETFIPSEEEALGATGDLVWRFQFRKGYNPASHRGVTTLVDVRFNSRDITADPNS